jgi:hypothetical protein
MSTEEDENTDGGEEEESTNGPYSASFQSKIAVHERDRHRCINCREQFDDLSHLDVDHVVERGSGGANTLRNKATECRRCHEAKHEERDHAPTIRFMSTGDMVKEDFIWFRHFWGEILPAMSAVVADYRIKPVFDIADNAEYRAWHIPMGDVRRLDEVLSSTEELKYRAMGAHHYMM